MPTWLPPEIYRDKAFADKYLIESELGIGGAGVVVGARHRELDERVAIKFLLPGQSSEAVARFRREARAASRIKNQHVVRINDVSTTDSGIPYIVMEYLEGVDLERMLQQSRNRQLPTADAIEFILQACEALAECHGLGIVHRDLKPSNLFCVHGADGLAMIKVLDFGISKLVTSTLDGNTTDSSRILGSPRYMSPEQFDNSTSVDNRTDIWAIGIILYELLTGVVPFADTDMLKIWQRIRSQEPAPVCKLRADLPAPLWPVIAKCLEKDRNRRYANLAELAKALLPFAPERSRASVARIVRTVESPGTMTSALDLPYRIDSTTSHAPTFNSIAARPRRRWTTTLGVMVAVAALALALLWTQRNVTVPAFSRASVDVPPAGAAVNPRSGPQTTPAVASSTASPLQPSDVATGLSDMPSSNVPAGSVRPTSPAVRPPPPTAPASKSRPHASASASGNAALGGLGGRRDDSAVRAEASAAALGDAVAQPTVPDGRSRAAEPPPSRGAAGVAPETIGGATRVPPSPWIVPIVEEPRARSRKAPQ